MQNDPNVKYAMSLFLFKSIHKKIRKLGDTK